MKIGIIAGHSQHREEDPERRYEFTRCRAAQRILVPLLQRAGHEVITTPASFDELENNPALEFKVDMLNSEAVDLAIELHLNASGADIPGDYSTAIYWDSADTGTASSSGRSCASNICHILAAGYPWKTIGARPQSYFGRGLYFLNKTRMPAVIVEPGFKDNADHRRHFDSRDAAALYAALVFAGISLWADKRLSKVAA